MSITEKDLELIEKALFEDLSENEKLMFLDKMNDVEFNERFQNEQLAFNEIQDEGQRLLKLRMNRIDKELDEKEVGKIATFRRVILTVAATGVTFLFFYFGFQHYSTSPSDKIYDKYYSSFANVVDPITKSPSKSDMSPFQLYEAGYFKNAIEGLNKDESWVATFYSALSYLEIDDPENAVRLMEQLQKLGPNELDDQLDWYHGLALISLERKSEAISHFKRLSLLDGSRLQSRALKILDDLGSDAN